MSKNSFKVNNSLHLRPQDTLPSDPEDGDLVQQNNTVYARANGQWKDLGANFNDPMTTRGDMLFRDAGNQTARLPIGVNGTVLKSDGQDVSWGAFDAAGVFNYIANPYAQNDTSDSSTSVTSGSFTVDRTTTAAELPSTNDAAWKLSGAGVTVGDYVAIHTSRAIALTDKTVGSMGVKLVDINGSANDDWKAQLYSTTDGEYVGQELEFNAGTNTYVIDAFTVPEKQYYIHMIAKVASPSAVSAEFFIQSEAESQVSYDGPWIAYTPSSNQGLGTITSNLQYRINGQNIDIKGDFTSGTTSSATARLALPDGYTASFLDASNFQILGWTGRPVASATIYSVISQNGLNYVEFGRITTGGSNSYAGIFGNTLMGSGETISLSFSVPVAELSNNVIPTVSDLQYENARARFYATFTNYTANTTFPFNIEDTTTFSPSLGIKNNNSVFSVESKGTYDITVGVGSNPAWPANTFVRVWVNRGSGFVGERALVRGPTSSSFFLSGNTSLELNPGDQFEIRADQNGTVITGSADTYIEIERRSDYSARAAGLPYAADGQYGVVKANLFKTNRSIFTYNSNATNILPLANVPKGKYRITIGVGYSFKALTTSNAYAQLILNGAQIAAIGSSPSGSTAATYMIGVSSSNIVEFPNLTNTISMSVVANNSGLVQNPYYVIEKLENDIEIGTDWD